MYACSTTTYTGFQVEMSEEESQKFEGKFWIAFCVTIENDSLESC